jgi:hypothetical protein
MRNKNQRLVTLAAANRRWVGLPNLAAGETLLNRTLRFTLAEEHSFLV